MRAGWVAAAMLTASCGGHDVRGVDAAASDSVGPHGDATTADAPLDAPAGSGFRVGGTAYGLRHPVLLALTAGATTRTLVLTEDGPFHVPGRLPDGATFDIAQVPGCKVLGVPGTISGGDISNVDVYCHGVVEVATAPAFAFPTSTWPVALAPAF